MSQINFYSSVYNPTQPVWWVYFKIKVFYSHFAKLTFNVPTFWKHKTFSTSKIKYSLTVEEALRAQIANDLFSRKNGLD